ncbi:hypothetical protein SFUMM280S_09637 [Streptomyces fumanus]
MPGERPATEAIIRSDHCGCDTMMRAAALLRSAIVSGRPWVMFDSTASTKASDSEPTK